MTTPQLSPRRAFWIGLILLLAALSYVFLPYWLAAKEKPLIEPNLWVAGALGLVSLVLLFSPGQLSGLLRKWMGKGEGK